MAKTLSQKLAEKGWTKEEIDKTLNIMYSPEKAEGRTVYTRRINPIIYWTALIVMIVGNLIISVVLIPFLLLLTSFQLYFVIAVAAFAFGLMFNLVINDIEHIDPQHHIIAGIFIPAFAIITTYVMVTVANRLSFVVQSPIHQNSIIVSVVYVVAFMLPYAVQKIRELASERKTFRAARI